MKRMKSLPQKKQKKNPGGRPSKLDNFTEDDYQQVTKLAMLGLTDKRLAEFYEISDATLYNWKNADPKFLEALNAGRSDADAKVAKSLYERAIGYEHDDLYLTAHKGKIISKQITKHYPPDVGAAKMILKNRHPELWRDVQRQEISGPGGEPIQQANINFNVNLDLSDLSDDELQVAEKLFVSGNGNGNGAQDV